MTATLTDIIQGVETHKAFKVPCRVATTANITLSGLQTIDGVTVAADDRVLVKDQTDGATNGIYRVSAGTWSRFQDFDGERDLVSGTKVFVTSGSSNGRREYYLQTDDPISIGTTVLTFALAEAAAFNPIYDTFLSKTANYTVASTDEGAMILVDTSGGAVTITLPSIASAGDFKIGVAKTTSDANAVTVARGSTDTINGATSIALAVQYETATLLAKSGTTNWIVTPRANIPRLDATQTWGGPNTFSALLTMTGAAQNWAKGADIASASTTDIGAATGNFVEVTGTTTITALGTVQAGTWRLVRFTGALTITHNATSLITLTAANIKTIAGDMALFVSLGSGNWRMVQYSEAQKVGTYTPTLTNIANTDARTAYLTKWERTIDHVHVWGRCDLDFTTSATITRVGSTIPFPSAFSALEDAAGYCGSPSTAGNAGAVWTDGVTADRVEFYLVCTGTANTSIVFDYTYRII
jgi:hypothetical protein